MKTTHTAVLLAAALLLSAPAFAQKAFPTPMAAAEALVDGVARHDDEAVRTVLGPDYAKVLPVRQISEDDVTSFLAAWARKRSIAQRDANTAFLEIGERAWSMPIPIVKSAAGWSFDARGAADEMKTRRIGRNELAVMRVALAYADAQEEYFRFDRDGDGARAFAAKFLSTQGKRDGLYWATLPDERPSPLGPMIAESKPGEPFHGYLYRILTAQGAGAPGGAKDYMRNGKLTEGFALVAWPAKYGETGVQTFIVSRDAVVYENDLGPGTDAVARAMKAYDPGAGWRKADVAD